MKLAVGCDHTAVEMKQTIIAHLQARGIAVEEVITQTQQPYPVVGYIAAKQVADGAVDGAVLICGTGAGISLAANKVRGIRAVVCSDPYTAKMAKAHNHANVLAFGARVVGEETAKMIVDAWLDTPCEGDRHADRVALITQIEETGTVK